MRERDMNRKMFHKGHWEVIAARFREQVSEYAIPGEEAYDEIEIGTAAAASIRALRSLAGALADRFTLDNEEFDKNIFLERCGFIV